MLERVGSSADRVAPEPAGPEGARGLDAGWLVPTPPLTAREARWATALLDDEASLRRWLRRGAVASDEPRRSDREGTGVRNEHPVVAVVVLSHNDRRAALRCLDAVDTLTYRRGAFFVVLVENSTDPAHGIRARELRARRYGFRVSLLRPDRNTGFAAGVNLAARHAFEAGADHLLLLNDDAGIPRASVDLVQELVALSGLLPDVAAIGPKVYFERHAAGPDVIASAGASFIDPPPQVGRPDSGMRGVVETDFLVGVCMLIPRRAWQVVGGFDARYFAYYEDTEWCYRARRHGLRIYCQRDVYVLHGDGDREFHKRNRDATYTRLAARNQVLLARQHPWFRDVVARRLTRKYRQLVRGGERRGAHGMVEGIVLARRQWFPAPASRRTRLTVVAGPRRAAAAGRPPVLFSMGRVNRHRGVEVLARLATLSAAAFEVHVRGSSNLDLRRPEDEAFVNRLCDLLRTSGALRRNAVTLFGAFDVVTREAFLRRYARRDAVLVHAARPEGFGLVLLEAMAHGVPVVADTHGGLAAALRDHPEPPMELIDFTAVRHEELLPRLLLRFADRRALARERRRARAYVAALPSAARMADAHREHVLALCAERRVAPPAVVLLSGGALYKAGGCGEWMASVGSRLRRDPRLRTSLVTVPGSDWAPVPDYRTALHGLPWREIRIRRTAAAPPASVRRATADRFRELVQVFAAEERATSRLYARTLRRFHRQIAPDEYWAMWNGAADELVAWYVACRPELSRHGVRQGLGVLLRGFLVENLLAKRIGAGACIYALDPSLGLAAAAERATGACGAYIVGMHSFTFLFYDDAVDSLPHVRGDEREHFKRVIRHLIGYAVIGADLVICVSDAIAQHLRSRLADYPLPPFRTIPNTLLSGARWAAVTRVHEGAATLQAAHGSRRNRPSLPPSS